MAKSRLGRGLQALIPVSETADNQGTGDLVALDLIDPNPFQPRREFDPEKLAELTESVRVHGVMQPVVLRKTGDRYQLVAGERRCRAAKGAGMSDIPALVREFSDRELLELAIVENLQREDLNPIEEALAYEQLMDQLALKQEEVATRVGKSRPYITNTLRLLQLPEVLKQHVSRGTLSAGHARALLAASSSLEQLRLADKIISDGLSVRQTEALVAKQKGKTGVSRETKHSKDGDHLDLEHRLQSALGTNVKIIHKKKRGKIEIEYYSNDDLERLLEILLR